MLTSGGVALTAPVVLVVLVGLVVLVAASISGGRRETDPNGERTTAIFLGVVNWVALFTVLFATFAIVIAVTGYIHSGETRGALGSIGLPPTSQVQAPLLYGRTTVSEPGGGIAVFQSVSPGYNVTSGALGAGLVALAALGVLRVYRHRLWAIIREPTRRSGPAGPPIRVYLLATAFAAVFIAVGAEASALFGIYRTVAPGVAGIGSGAHGPGLRQLIDSAYLALGALVIFRSHHRLAFPPAPPPEPLPPV